MATAAAFDVAIDHAVDDVLVQVARLPEFQPPQKSALEQVLQRPAEPPPKVKIAVDASVDGITGQQTAATQLLDQRLLLRAAAKFPQFDVMAVTPDNLGSARFILVSTLTSLETQGQSGRYRISVALADIRSGLVVAQSVAQSTAQGVDATPTAYFRDSPALTKDRLVDGQIKTSQTSVGSEADGVYLASLNVAALIAEGSRLYDDGKYAESLKVYEVAANRPDGKQQRVFNGLYLNNNQLGRTEAAEKAFGHIVALGLATNNLAVKFLFKPASTDFLTDPKVSQSYPMWLKVLGKEIVQSKQCLTVVGHSSHTGSESVNGRLSLQRATALQKRLEALEAQVNGRLQSVGMGFRENLIGTGTDDLRDALDRRVEFKVRSCN
jgi:outer membrane protein OmpA-like peptidoglycan-associated protein